MRDLVKKLLKTDEEKERERKERFQHPHIAKSKSHWDWDTGYLELDEEKKSDPHS